MKNNIYVIEFFNRNWSFTYNRIIQKRIWTKEELKDFVENDNYLKYKNVLGCQIYKFKDLNELQDYVEKNKDGITCFDNINFYKYEYKKILI